MSQRTEPFSNRPVTPAQTPMPARPPRGHINLVDETGSPVWAFESGVPDGAAKGALETTKQRKLWKYGTSALATTLVVVAIALYASGRLARPALQPTDTASLEPSHAALDDKLAAEALARAKVALHTPSAPPVAPTPATEASPGPPVATEPTSTPEASEAESDNPY